MNSIAPMSTPRVGCATSSSLGFSSNSRPMISFCWLPPDSARAGSAGIRRPHVETLDDVGGAPAHLAVVHHHAAMVTGGR